VSAPLSLRLRTCRCRPTCHRRSSSLTRSATAATSRCSSSPATISRCRSTASTRSSMSSIRSGHRVRLQRRHAGRPGCAEQHRGISAVRRRHGLRDHRARSAYQSDISDRLTIIDWKPGNFDLAADASYSEATRKGADDTYFSTVRALTPVHGTAAPARHIFDMAFSNPNYPNAPPTSHNEGGHYEADGGSDFKDQTMEFRLDGAWDPGTGVKAYAASAVKSARRPTIRSR